MILKKLPWPLLAVVACALLATYPVWRWGLQTNGDAIFHAMWYSSLSRQILAGDWYPRWLVDMNAGLGSPVFFYYAPLPYYSTLLFKPFIHGDAFGLRQLGFSAALSFVASGVTCFMWLDRVTSRKAAAVAAILYVIAPYHLSIDLFNRNAFGELWAFAAMPLILYFVVRIEDSKYAMLGIAFAYCALIVTHLPSVVIFSVFVPLYALCRSSTQDRFRYLVVTIVGVLLGIALSAIYLLPAMTMQKEISVADFSASGYHLRWLKYQPLQLADFSSQLFWSALLMTCLSTTAISMCWPAKSNRTKRELLFAVIMAIVSTFMMFPPSDFVWRLSPTLQTIQFPWRFSSLLCLATAALIANGLSHLKWSRAIVHVSAAVVTFALLFTFAAFCIFTLQKISPSRSGPSPDSEFAKRFALRRDAPEYRPAAVASIQEVHFQEMLGRICKTDNSIARGCVSEGEGSLTFTEWQPRKITFDTVSATGMTVNVSQFFLAGWQAKLEGQLVPIRASAPDGLINLTIPSGSHHVELVLTQRKPEFVGMLISGIALLIAIVMFLRTKAAPGRRTPKS